MSEEIANFFKERMNAWINAPDQKKKVRNGTLLSEIESEAAEKFDPAEWCTVNARRAKSLSMVTHNPKFTHPDIRIYDVSVVNAVGKKHQDGYVRTGNCEYEPDVYGDAASLGVLKFLQLKMADGKTVLEHFEANSEVLRQVLGVSPGQFAEFRDEYLKIKLPKSNDVTSDLLKQVYFPVGEGYHLLSLLTPGGLIYEQKRRINEMRFGDDAKKAKELRRNGKYSEHGFADIPNLAVVGYGGTKTQNVGQQNLIHGGKAVQLMTLPPVLQNRHVYPPRSDFFLNCLRRTDFEDVFESIDRLRSTDYNNVSIRNAIERLYAATIDLIVNRAWAVREEYSGWSFEDRYNRVPLYQKLWLDDARIVERASSENWQAEAISAMVDWIRRMYEKRKNLKGPKFDSSEVTLLTKLAIECKGGLS